MTLCKKIIFVLIGIFSVISVIFLINPFLLWPWPIGGIDDPSPEMIPHFFMPGGPVNIHHDTEELRFTAYAPASDGSSQFFPRLSPSHVSSIFLVRENSDDLYLVVIWFFEDKKTFIDNAESLDVFYLERMGTIATVNPLGNQDQFTSFENNITSGYFFMAEPADPAISAPWYLIGYYGTVKSGNLSRQNPYLTRLMAYGLPGSDEYQYHAIIRYEDK